jgi:hypothetical protein
MALVVVAAERITVALVVALEQRVSLLWRSTTNVCIDFPN